MVLKPDSISMDWEDVAVSWRREETIVFSADEGGGECSEKRLVSFETRMAVHQWHFYCEGDCKWIESS